ncbi:MAG: DUF2934 domain-containing protein [Pirellulales bacterium]
MNVSLESLELTPAELQRSRDIVRTRAYCKWQAAGCPGDRELEFWAEAEREWIAHEYVPHRPLDGVRADGDRCVTPAPAQEQTERQAKSRRHSSAGTNRL